MTIHFASFIKYIPSHTHSNFMYFFSTKPMSSNERGSVKIGITETQPLHKRLGQYKHVKNIEVSVIPVNIYYIHTDNVSKRESILKRMMNSHPDMKCYQGAEYFEGNIVIMLNMFAYIALATLDEIDTLYVKKSFKSMFKRITNIKYDVIYLTEIFPYTEDEDNDIERMILTIDTESECNFSDCDESESDLGQTNYSCSKCKKYCKDRRGLSVHESKCGKTKKPICPHCNTEFLYLGSLHNHLNSCKVLKQEQIYKELTQKENTIIELKQALEEKEINPVDTLSNQLLQDRIIQLELLCKEKDLHIHFLTKSLEDKETMINDKNFIIELLKK
jgi:hypothetical protein